jgi:hypothetical protein
MCGLSMEINHSLGACIAQVMADGMMSHHRQTGGCVRTRREKRVASIEGCKKQARVCVSPQCGCSLRARVMVWWWLRRLRRRWWSRVGGGDSAV